MFGSEHTEPLNIGRLLIKDVGPSLYVFGIFHYYPFTNQQSRTLLLDLENVRAACMTWRRRARVITKRSPYIIRAHRPECTGINELPKASEGSNNVRANCNGLRGNNLV